MSSRIPLLLEPYLSLPPEASLILLTNVLGASSNWLVLRFLYSALISSEASSSLGTESEDETKVLLVSFMRDLGFWRENARRLGLDLDKFAAKKRFDFVDGLSELFVPKHGKPAVGRDEQKFLNNPSLASVFDVINAAIQNLKNSHGGERILLVIDQLDLLLAAGVEGINAVNIGEMLMGSRDEVHATVTTLSADYPLVSSRQTPLEIAHASFLLSIAHQADFIMGVRLLDTGTARDVSGVVRITVGDAGSQNGEDLSKKVGEKELLYFIGGDGGVRVFERGQ